MKIILPFLVTCPREGDRCRTATESLIKFKVPGTDLEIRYDGYPTLTDGRVSNFVVELVFNKNGLLIKLFCFWSYFDETW